MSHASTPTEIARFVSTRLHASKKGKLQQLEACAKPKELSKVGDATILVGCPSGKGKRWARRRFLPGRRSLRRVRLSAPVRQIDRSGSQITVRTDTDESRFDQIVLACHSDQALALIDAPDPKERQLDD